MYLYHNRIRNTQCIHNHRRCLIAVMFAMMFTVMFTVWFVTAILVAVDVMFMVMIVLYYWNVFFGVIRNMFFDLKYWIRYYHYTFRWRKCTNRILTWYGTCFSISTGTWWSTGTFTGYGTSGNLTKFGEMNKWNNSLIHIVRARCPHSRFAGNDCHVKICHKMTAWKYRFEHEPL